MARPATPMTTHRGDCVDGALPYKDAAAFLGISLRKLYEIIAAGELDVVYEGTKPRVLKGQLIRRLEEQLERSRMGGVSART